MGLCWIMMGFFAGLYWINGIDMGFYWIIMGYLMGFYRIWIMIGLMGLPFGVIKHGWLENPLSMEDLIGKSLINDKWSISHCHV